MTEPRNSTPGYAFYEHWSMSDRERDSLRRNIETSAYRDVPDTRDLRGLESRIGRENLIRQMAGTSDKKSRAWKSARDGLTRIRNGKRGMGSKMGARVQSAAQRNRVNEARQANRPVNVSLEGDFRISAKWWRNGKASVTLTGAAREEFFAAMEAGDVETAMYIAMEHDEEGYFQGAHVAEFDNFGSASIDW